MRPAATLGLLLAACNGCADGPPPAFAPLRQSLSEAPSWGATLAWSDPSTGSRSRVQIGVDATQPKVHMEVIQGPGGALWWTEERGVRVGGEDLQVPVPSLNDRAEEMWSEVRSGLADARWSSGPGPSRAPLPPPKDITWAALDLPFDWARDLTVHLGVDAQGAPAHVVVETTQPPLQATAQMLRGGPRTLMLSETGKLWMVVEEWQAAP